jgi:acyl-CoA synthetase (AMP-forming)/AMP-acid ligase II
LNDRGFRAGEVAALAIPNGARTDYGIPGNFRHRRRRAPESCVAEKEFRFYLSSLAARILVTPDRAGSPAVVAADALGIDVLKIHSNPHDPADVFQMSLPRERRPARPARTTDAALLLFTSATTATPKLVPMTGEDLCTIAGRQTGALGLSSADRFLSLMPLFHHFGLAASLAQLYAGGVLIDTHRVTIRSLSWTGWRISSRHVDFESTTKPFHIGIGPTNIRRHSGGTDYA